MPKSSARQAVASGLVVLSVTILSARALAELIFHAPFDGSREATVCKGPGKATFVPPAKDRQAQPVFGEGLIDPSIGYGTGGVDHAPFPSVSGAFGSTIIAGINIGQALQIGNGYPVRRYLRQVRPARGRVCQDVRICSSLEIATVANC